MHIFFEYLFWVIFVYTDRKWIASLYHKYCYCCCSVTQSCLTLCNPMDSSMPGFPVFYHLLELAQTHVHWVSDAIQPSHPLLPPFPPAINLYQHKGFFPVSWLFVSGGQSIRASASALVFPMNIQDWFPLGLTNWIALLSKGLSRLGACSSLLLFTFQPNSYYQGANLNVISGSNNELIALLDSHSTLLMTFHATILLFCVFYLLCFRLVRS